MTETSTRSDTEDLRRLPLLHYGLSAAVALATAAVGVPVFFGWRAVGNPGAYSVALDRTPSLGGWLFLVVGGLMLLYGLALAAGLVAAGVSIRRRRAHAFCLVVAAASTFFFPLGTLLGFHTINVLISPPARRAFGLA